MPEDRDGRLQASFERSYATVAMTMMCAMLVRSSAATLTRALNATSSSTRRSSRDTFAFIRSVGRTRSACGQDFSDVPTQVAYSPCPKNGPSNPSVVVQQHAKSVTSYSRLLSLFRGERILKIRLGY